MEVQNLPPQVHELVARLLAPKASRRFQTPAELSEALDNVLTRPTMTRSPVDARLVALVAGAVALTLVGWWLLG
jgi:hypothetical protein